MPVSVNKNLAASYILEDPLGRIANDGRVSNLGRVGKKGYVDSRFAYDFDGIDDYAETATPTPFSSGSELEISFSIDMYRATNQPALFGPTAAGDFSSRAVINSDGSLAIRPTASDAVEMVTAAGVIQLNTRYLLRLTRSANTYSMFINGVAVGSVTSASATMNLQTFARAATLRHFPGFMYSIKINGVLWPMADRNQAIQLPEPSGLGAELITPTVLENPHSKGTQWTYLGAGRWQYVGDGSLNELRFINAVDQPAAGYLEFEIESISGQLNCTSGNNSPAVVFNTLGVKRYFYTSKGASSENTFLFKRHFSGVGIVTSCVIKNISFKPLGTCNPMTLVNVTSDRWQEVAQ